MESRAKMMGHSIHPMLIVFPLGLFAASLGFDANSRAKTIGLWHGIGNVIVSVGSVSAQAHTAIPAKWVARVVSGAGCGFRVARAHPNVDNVPSQLATRNLTCNGTGMHRFCRSLLGPSNADRPERSRPILRDPLGLTCTE